MTTARFPGTIPPMLFALDPPRRNAALGILGLFLACIFVTWFPIQALRVPLPRNPVDRTVATAAWQTLWMIVMPYVWARVRLGRSPASLGITTRNLGRGFALGCALYLLALAAFVYGSHDPVFQNHPIRRLPVDRMFLLGSTMCVIAAGTDIATRGFILLTLVDRTGVPFAVAMQNIFWILGHTNEIRVLSGPLGWGGAVGLNLVLGLLGDSIALRTRNVLGLALAHALLNVAMILYLRGMA